MNKRCCTALLVALLISACQTQPAPLPAAPTVVAIEPTAAAVPTAGVAVVPTEAAATPAASPAPVQIEPVSAQIPESVKPSSSAVFARYAPAPVQTQAQVQAPAIAPDLGNVDMAVLLSPEQRARIAANGFAVSPGDTKEFYEIYERARYDYVPIFVTSDSLLHVYHLLFDKTLRQSETQFFVPMLTRLDWALLATSLEQQQALAGTPWAEAARRNAAYFAVAVKTLAPEWSVPEQLRDLVEPDLASIAAHDQISPSAIFPAYPFGEDWSQYVPRGHYTKSEELKRYFVAMMWHGRMTFRASDPTETQQAALLTLALQQTKVDDQPANAIWSSIYEPTVFFVGRSDDLTPSEYDSALQSAYGQVSAPRELVDDAKFAAFQAEAGKLRPPEILGMVVWEDDPDKEATTKGLRFMGQRFVPDSFVFGQLIDSKVPQRMLPKALDFFAAVGSDRALQHLQDSGDTALPKYQENMDRLRATFAGYGDDVWTQNLYWSWIHSLRPLLAPADAGYPQFMRSPAWQDKQLTTALGSWTELKRDTILYTKQVYAEMGAGPLPPPEPQPPKGYVEPVPEFYARVAALTTMTVEGLASRGLLNDDDRRALEAMANIATRLQTMAEKELRNEPLTEDEYTYIRFYGGHIEQLTFAAGDEAIYLGDQPDGGGSPAGGEPLQAAVVADVATDPNGQVLEEGVGRVFPIYVVAPIEGRLVLTKGGVFSHYEFAQPLSNRLTDESWRAQLDAGNAPLLAEWTNSFMVQQVAEQPLQDAILFFNNRLVETLWFTDMNFVEEALADPELSDTRMDVEQLKAQGQFVGAKRLNLSFLSADFQDANNAVVTTRERWSDELLRGSPQAGEPAPVKIGTRGPYETVATYTMTKAGDEWKITRIVLRPEPPPWK